MVIDKYHKVIIEAKEFIKECLKCEERKTCVDKEQLVRFLDKNI